MVYTRAELSAIANQQLDAFNLLAKNQDIIKAEYRALIEKQDQQIDALKVRLDDLLTEGHLDVYQSARPEIYYNLYGIRAVLMQVLAHLKLRVQFPTRGSYLVVPALPEQGAKSATKKK